MTSTTNAAPTLTACPDCDLLIDKTHIGQGHAAKCRRCGRILYHNKANTVNRTLALVVTALIIFIPANLVPVISMDLLGRPQQNILISGVLQLLNSGYLFVGLAVFLTTIVFPVLQLTSLLMVLTAIKFNRYSRHLLSLFKLTTELKAWSMIEIYLLGVLLSCIKLQDDAEVIFNGGFLALTLCLIITLFSIVTLDSSYVWSQLERMKHGK